MGDPINAVRIFNDKKVDELMVLDIDASIQNREPDYQVIRNLASECRMPLCYGGGVSTADQVDRIVGLGVEKVAMCTIALQTPAVLEEAASRVGNQSVIGVMEVRRGFLGKAKAVAKRGTLSSGLAPLEYAKKLQNYGVGEVVVNDIDRDGTCEGYDLDLAREIIAGVDVPVTVLGGAGSLDHIEELISQNPIVGAAAGSLFVFKGRFRAVLINYPTVSEKRAAITRLLGAPREEKVNAGATLSE